MNEMDPFLTILDTIKEQPSGYEIKRDGKQISLTQNELEEAVFFYYDKLGQDALDEASYNTGKNVSQTDREKLLEEITLNLSVLVHGKIREIAEKVFSN